MLLLVVLLFSPTVLAADKPPNVLFLFTDDQRNDTIAALGNPVIKTPNLDALAKSGMVFNNAYCLGSNVGAVCRPSRNMLLSGRAYFRFGQQASGDDPNFPTTMKGAGYHTYHHGKRGNTALEIQERFDVNRYLNDNEARMLGEPGQEIVDAAIAYLQQRPNEKPFFMYLAFASPHDPRVAARRYMDLYRREEIPLPKNYLPLHPFDNGEQTVRDEQLAPWPRTEDEIRKHLHDYYAVISGLDFHIGRLLQALREAGEYEDTIIIFSSDHGLAMGSHGLMGKQSLYEHSMKPPLIFSGPGIKAGRTDALVYLLDIFPTVCDLIGADQPAGLDGRSFAAVLRGETDRTRESIFNAYGVVQRAYRDDRWKLIRYPHINQTQLFDLQHDPDEVHNLADETEQSQRIERMLAAMADWQRELGDSTPLTSATPRDPKFTPPPPEAKAEKKK